MSLVYPKRSRIVPIIVLVLVLATGILWAQVPEPGGWNRRIPYEGFVALDGSPYDDANTELVFSLFADATTSTVSWTETLSNVNVSAGRFSVVFGDSPGNPIPETVFARRMLYLGIEVNGVALEGRQRILAVPFAVAGRDSPIGTIVAWHKNLGGTVPVLPESWVECNGQAISDPASLYDGLTVPDLNGAARFLRGDTQSGIMESDQLQSHTHTDSGHQHGFSRPRWYATESTAGVSMYYSEDGAAVSNVSTTTNETANLGDPTPSTAGSPRHGTETRPVNMSVVWIIKIK